MESELNSKCTIAKCMIGKCTIAKCMIGKQKDGKCMIGKCMTVTKVHDCLFTIKGLILALITLHNFLFLT